GRDSELVDDRENQFPFERLHLAALQCVLRLGAQARRSCGPFSRVVKLNGHGPRHTIADVESHVHYARCAVVHNLGTKVEEPMGVKRFVIMVHDPPQTTRRSWPGHANWPSVSPTLSKFW